ncbi:hypothetical protein ACFYO2_46740 [Streptomyces sp. NPDC006602]|uniref:hypothetical protein n=1 Tax=Streptomyces sp. NPDC006602 TaxID=3364751 RepID=UPI003696F2FA
MDTASSAEGLHVDAVEPLSTVADAPTDVVRALQALRDEQVERTHALVETVVALHR